MVAMSERREGRVGKGLGVLPVWTAQEKMGKWSEEKGMVCGEHRRPSCAWRLVCQFARDVVFFCGSWKPRCGVRKDCLRIKVFC